MEDKIVGRCSQSTFSVFNHIITNNRPVCVRACGVKAHYKGDETYVDEDSAGPIHAKNVSALKNERKKDGIFLGGRRVMLVAVC